MIVLVADGDAKGTLSARHLSLLCMLTVLLVTSPLRSVWQEVHV